MLVTKKGRRRKAPGLWADVNVPKEGWSCTRVEDLGDIDATCAMCQIKEIRYVHHMAHPDYPDVLGCGCVCAGRMEGSLEEPLLRERRAKRFATFQKLPCKVSRKGNFYINHRGLNVTVYQRAKDLHYQIVERRSGLIVYRGPFEAQPGERDREVFEKVDAHLAARSL